MVLYIPQSGRFVALSYYRVESKGCHVCSSVKSGVLLRNSRREIGLIGTYADSPAEEQSRPQDHWTRALIGHGGAVHGPHQKTAVPTATRISKVFRVEK